MFGLFVKKPGKEALRLYEAVVLKARDPAFFSAAGVPDTFEGRFEMMVLHLWLLHMRTRNAGNDAGKRVEEVFQEFVEHLDRTYREIGVSDLKVPKRMEVSASALYGRMAAYTAAMELQPEAAQREALQEAVSRNITGGTGKTGDIADYILAALNGLNGQDIDAILAGTISFPELSPEGSQ